MRRAYLVRHAKAGSRSDFDGDDLLRPLNGEGRRQAEAICNLLEPHGLPARLLSSPARRCVETFEPLAETLQLPIEKADWLAEGSDPMEALEGLRRLEDGVVAVCSHGDVIWGILEWAARGGVEIGQRPDAAKSSAWVFDWPDDSAEGVPVRAAYLEPPG